MVILEKALTLVMTEEHEALRQAVRNFAQKEIVPIAAEHDETGEFPLKTVKMMGEMGLMGIEMPEEYGGAEMDVLAYVLAMIEIAKADASHSTVVSVNNSLYCHGILKFGTEEQKQKFLVPVASGEKIGAYSLTEPMSGSDAATMTSRAVLNEAGTHYIINGTKSWVTSGPVADFMVMFTVTDPDAGSRGITAFLIEADTPGFIRGKKEPKLGIRASATSEVVFDNYQCPIESVLGEPGQGFKIAMTALDSGRIGIASQSLGIAEAAYEASVEYARTRVAFGGPIGRLQIIQQKIADMKTRMEAGRALLYNAVLAKERHKRDGSRFTTEAAMAKLFCSEMAAFVTDEALQIHGGIGYSKELPIERYYRDARITRIYEGTNEIQKIVIARNELGLR
jgi:alkylation response protein AidB-like acyl-CoA dehydrogenase